MRCFLSHLRERARDRRDRGTSYCEECGEACTPSCRREAQLDRYHEARFGIGYFRH